MVPLRDVNLQVPPAGNSYPVLARIRSRHPDVPARLELLDGETRRGGRARLVFEEPVRAAAPGQSAVFYAPDRPELLLGGGRIDRPGGGADPRAGRGVWGCKEGGTV